MLRLNRSYQNIKKVWSQDRTLKYLSLSLAMTLACGPKKSPTENFLRSDGLAFSTDSNFISNRPLDSGETFKLAYGYDKMSGLRHHTCLSASDLTLRKDNIHQTNGDFFVVKDKEDLANRIGIEFNAEASGSYGIVIGTPSSKTKLIKNVNFNSQSIVGIASMVYQDEEYSLGVEQSPLSYEMQDLLLEDKIEFRRRCGDSYTKSVTTGAIMYVVVTMTLKGQGPVNQQDLSVKLENIITPAMDSNGAAAPANPDTEPFANFDMSVTCHTAGITPTLCAIPFENNGSGDINTLLSYFADAKAAFVESLQNDPTAVVAIEEALEDYPKPASVLAQERDEVFFDYRVHALQLRNLVSTETHVNTICNIDRLPSCIDLQVSFGKQIKNCSRMEYWNECDPQAVDIARLLAEQADKKLIGKVILWKDMKQGVESGQTLILDFDRAAGTPGALQADTTYNLKSFNFRNVASAFQTSLRPGWRLRLWEFENGTGRYWLIGAADARTFYLGWFNDKARSFRLERAGDYPD